MNTFFLRVIALGVLVTSISSITSLACRCAAPPPPKRALESAAAVFTGTVKSVVSVEGKQMAVTFLVESVWKGAENRILTVYTDWGSSCGYSFQTGKAYIVYSLGRAEDQPVRLHVSLCSRTRELARATDDLKELGEARKPKAN